VVHFDLLFISNQFFNHYLAKVKRPSGGRKGTKRKICARGQ
jgi:hypothetical protein